ncbi:MAG: DNA/RNA nuclease SfsA [Muribaculaceae bacterium]|nr:DNA/RNA nuclease SfsA [Muribaculaceae bacterium]MCM1399695.1 DNA/RNA nuclease SfsA [Clostridium sp.]MCM1460556.1 DNA/RNA nuclease SfsA [Bacteroides sp.]
MKYKNIVKGTFINRPNRFIAYVEMEGKIEKVHVKNTGRCRELLVPNAIVYLEKSDNPNRKTAYDLVAVEKVREGKTPLLINMDSQAPNYAVEEWLRKGNIFSKQALIRREHTYKKSRFDFYIEDGEKKAFLEVKGVTLEEDGLALFPDAPTERGVKHIKELAACMDEGYEAYILFVIQMKEMYAFSPNDKTHPDFGKVLREAADKGVHVLAVDCRAGTDYMELDKYVEVRL